ncbi:L-asparaginase 1 [Lingula anatina]|uniref:L-asparaginase 1 n=1 Tax=Lingula anatina TaxID=7574 RepID=A0A1S3JXG7_LINAN|nr:L-asparaginase 1 [Lingula anatina]|eukprot:XP_013415002.1 L-asparaginase 1 [Lingula anatina]
MSTILAIQTGGTIDKDYPRTLGGYAFEICEPAVERMFNKIQTNFQITYQTVCRKDSQDITDEDRSNIFLACREAPQSKILITHGTDTMIETAEYLARKEDLSHKVIVITGSFKPDTFKDSDAEFNVGVAIGALQCLNGQGVYIAMNGCVYSWKAVQRDAVTGKFVSKGEKMK